MRCHDFHRKCQAECCSDITPIPIKIFEANKDKIVNPVVSSLEIDETDPFGDGANRVHRTLSGKCIFLNSDHTCNIYEVRPQICKAFGNESHPFLTCSWQAKDGRARSRQEKRRIERETASAHHRLIKRFQIAFSREDADNE